MPPIEVLKKSEVKDLIQTIVSLKTPQEGERFFRDLLTEKELKEFASRWKAAQMLAKNISYSRIIEKTGLSSTTIARISKWLNKGMGGYRLIIDRVQHHTPLPTGKGRR